MAEFMKINEKKEKNPRQAKNETASWGKKRSRLISLKTLCSELAVTLQGDADCQVDHVCTLQGGHSGGIAFLVNPQYQKFLSGTAASAVVLGEADAGMCPVNAIVSRDPYFTWSQIAHFFDDRPQSRAGVHSSVVMGAGCEVDPSAGIGPNCVLGNDVTIGPGVSIGPGCVIGEGSCVGEDSLLEANVTLAHQVTLGQRVRVASGTVIGSDGFGIAKHRGAWHKVPQLGGVVIEDDVEIGANCTIDRGAIENTVIEQGAKLDNLIQVAHNVRIGAHTAIAGCVGIAGSTVIGKNCMIGGQAGFAGHLTIGDDVIVMGGTEVSKSIREPGLYASGVGGLMPLGERRKNTARVRRLRQLFEQVKELERIVKERNA